MKLFFLVAIFTVSLIPCLGQNEKDQSEKIITACPFQLTAIARTANFRFNFLYVLEVGASGEVTKIDELRSSEKYKKFKFVRDDLFLGCMKKWRLDPIGKYFVSFNVGTTSSGTTKGLPFNYVRITDPNKQVLTIELWTGQSAQ